ncbi:MAG TPA: MFS transporter [Acidimicrobiales bacterium]|nr:MFS transporter [Acidimicrobiales bacterium]
MSGFGAMGGRQGWRTLLNPREVSKQVGPTGLTPIMVLLLAATLERFLVTSTGILLPNIRDSFHISNQTAITATTLTSILPAVASPWVGYWADRTNRVRMAQWGTVAVGVIGIGMGVSPTFPILALFLFGGGLGQLVNVPSHSSLITDYYPPSAMGVVWTFYLFATSAIGLVAGPVAGVVGQATGWRTTFIVLSIPVMVAVIVLGRLKDPGRGASIGIASQLAKNEERSSFWEGFRRLKAIRSLRRTWWAATFFGGGVVAFANLQSIFFKDVYHFSTSARGNLTTLFGLGGLIGTIVGGAYVQRRMAAGKPELLPVINGAMVIEFGLCMVLMGIAPNRWLAVGALCLLAVGAAGYAPAYQAMIGLVTTPRLRGQAYSYSLIWVTFGAIIVAPTIGGIANHHERAATYVLGVLMVVAGMIEITARKFVARDVAQAQAVQTASDVNALLAVRGLEVAYPGNVQILFGVDLDVHEGEIIALLGTNGAGKSTFLRAVSGTMDPIGGAIFFNGRDVTHADAVTKALLGMALVPGDRGVFPGLTVADNLRIAGWTFRRDTAYVRESQERVLGYFPVLRERWDVPAGNLSGGEQQMLVLAQALMGRPKLLMIDELTLGLAPVVVEQLLDTVRRLADDGTTILLVEQSVNVALTLAKKAVFMEKGEIRFSGETKELLERPDVLRAVFLEGTANAVGSQPARTRPRELATTNGNGNGHTPVALEVAGVSKRFGGVTANKDVDLKLYEGQILGLMGPNGAGKTTLFDLISGFFPVDTGRIMLHGVDVTDLPPDARARLGLGRSFQDSKLFPALTVEESIKVAFERQLEVRDPVAAALNLPAVRESEGAVQDRVDELIDLLGLKAFRNKFVSEISTGTRRMADLACILAHDPTVILFDEPSSGIAQRETEQLGPVLRRIREMTGSSLLVIEHDMPLLTGLADEVCALDLGRTVMRGSPEVVLSDPRVVAAYLGTTAEVVGRSGALPSELAKAAETVDRPTRSRAGSGRRAPGGAAARTGSGTTSRRNGKSTTTTARNGTAVKDRAMASAAPTRGKQAGARNGRHEK